jgi:hypothetical protein
MWPDRDESLLKQFVGQLELSREGSSYRSVLRRFQGFFSRRALTQSTLRAWLREGLKQTPVHVVIQHCQIESFP